MPQTFKHSLRLCVFGTILWLVGCGNSGNSSNPLPIPAPTPQQITFTNVGARGIFDPSITRDPSDITGRLWMSYSAVENSVTWQALNVDAIATRLAYSDDNGNTWTDSGAVVNNFEDVTLPLANPLDAGTWVNEVSQLIYDPNAVANERWKILWHHYLVLNRLPIDDRRRFEHGWIAMKMASSPEELATAPEIKLFAGNIYDPGNNTTGTPVLQLDTLNQDLNNCSVFTEPGMYASNTALYVSLQCETIDFNATPPVSLDRLIVLLKCSGGSCGASANWSYQGTIFQKSDAVAFGFDSGFAAPGLFASTGGVYLVVTGAQFVTPSMGAAYVGLSGCRIFRFTDIDSALLQQTGAQPTLIGSINGSAESFNGACSYHASASQSGMFYSEINTSVTDAFFQIFMSRINF